jgi:hypothetical protein
VSGWCWRTGELGIWRTGEFDIWGIGESGDWGRLESWKILELENGEFEKQVIEKLKNWLIRKLVDC